MITTRTESTNMKVWQEPYWQIKPHYVSALEISVVPPAPLSELEELPFEELSTSGEFNLIESWGQLEEDRKDLQFGLMTKLRYCKQGTKGFTLYRDYIEKKLRD